MGTKLAGAAFAAIMVMAGTAYGQTSTTTTTSKTTTTTTTNSWKSPDGNKGGSNSVTNTNTKSKSMTVGRPGPSSTNVSRPASNNGPGYDYGPTGSWSLAAGKDRCTLSLYKGFNAEGSGATTSGCTSADLKAIGNWILQNGGHTLVLTKSLVVPFATLRLVGPGRFQGTGSNGQTITVWR